MVRALYQKCRLVHADLSEYNILVHDNQLYCIDVSQAVELDHPRAFDFLREGACRGSGGRVGGAAGAGGCVPGQQWEGGWRSRGAQVRAFMLVGGAAGARGCMPLCWWLAGKQAPGWELEDSRPPDPGWVRCRTCLPGELHSRPSKHASNPTTASARCVSTAIHLLATLHPTLNAQPTVPVQTACMSTTSSGATAWPPSR